MSKSEKYTDQGLEEVIRALSHLSDVPQPEEGYWENGREAFLAQARQLKPQPVSPTNTERPKRWTAVLASMLPPKIQALKEINMTSLATIFITFAAVFALAIGGVDAAQSSLPGMPLYPLKTNWESVQLSLTNDPHALAERFMSIAHNRLQEGINLAQGGREIPPDLVDQYMSNLKTAVETANGLDEPLRSQLLIQLQTQLETHQRLLMQAKTQTQNRTSSAQNQLALMLKTTQQVQERVRLRINQQTPSQPPAGSQNQIQNNNNNQNQNQVQNQTGDQVQEPLQNQFQFQFRATEQAKENNLNKQQNQEQEKGQGGKQKQNNAPDGNNNNGGHSTGEN